jgi:hypothetical protein
VHSVAVALVGVSALTLDHDVAVQSIEPLDIDAAVVAAQIDCSVEKSRWMWVVTIEVASCMEALELEVPMEPWS